MTNTTSAHTPGPWRLDGSIGTMNLDVVYAYGRIAMLECENDEISDDQLMANARMIAAAPDLLAALYKAQVSLCGAFNPRDRQALEAINAAIDKATGA